MKSIFGLLSFSAVLITTSLAADEKQVAGFKLPNPSDPPKPITLGGVKVTSVTVYGCPSELASILRLDSGLVVDPNCDLLFLAPGEELKALREPSLIRSSKESSCGSARVVLEPQDFVAVHRAYKVQTSSSGNGGEPPSSSGREVLSEIVRNTWDDCQLTGEVCASPDEVSFGVGCAGGGSISVSTSGDVTLTGTPGDFSFSYSF